MANVDYKVLCQELFRTTDVEELRKIAEHLYQKNPRQAGRKKKFTEDDVALMRELRSEGISVLEIAERYGTSRQMVSKYLNQAPPAGYTMRLTLMYQNRPCTAMDINFQQELVRVQNYTKDTARRAFGTMEEVSWKDFQEFLKGRCPAGTSKNERLQVIEKTNGRTASDDLWLRIQRYEREED